MIPSHFCYALNCFFPVVSRCLLNCLVKLHKSGIRAVFQAPCRTATAPLLAKLSMPSFHQVLLQKLLVFVSRSIHGSASSLFQDYFVLLAQSQIQLADRMVAHGQLHNFLRIPFLPNPAGRCSIQFMGNAAWNSLPDATRSPTNLVQFK